MAISFVQATNGFNNSGTLLTIAYPSNVTAGDFLIAVLSVDNTGGSAISLGVSDNVNGNWTKLITVDGAFSFQTDIWYFNGSAAGSITVSLTSPSTLILEGAIAEYSGVSPTNPFDGVTPLFNSYTSNVSSLVCPNLTTISANDWVLGVMGYPGNAGTVTVSGSYNLRTGLTAPGAMFADIPAPAPGTYTGCTYTVQFAGNGAAISVALAPFVPTAQPSLDYSPGAGGVALYSPKAIAW